MRTLGFLPFRPAGHAHRYLFRRVPTRKYGLPGYAGQAMYHVAEHLLVLDVLRGVDLEHAVAPTVAVVDDGRAAGLLVDEQEEVVTRRS